MASSSLEASCSDGGGAAIDAGGAAQRLLGETSGDETFDDEADEPGREEADARRALDAG